MTLTLNPARLARRRRCHGSWWCCQYVDHPLCNSWAEPHRWARRRYRARAAGVREFIAYRRPHDGR